MDEQPHDLLALLAEARQIVPDDRHIWCTASETFDSRIVPRRGLLLGGAISPYFLRDAGTMSGEIPWAVRLRHCRVVVCSQAAHEPLAAWLPLMESAAGAGESLLVVTESIGSELLQTFLVNTFKGTLRACVVHPARDRYASPGAGAQLVTPPPGVDQLPRIDEVWVRRGASGCFPNANDPAWSAATLQNFAMIETGGENYDDLLDRLRFLMRGLQRSNPR
ncbi:hypothetical protein BH20VER1_BH20VER1_26310 [soil metagenome]